MNTILTTLLTSSVIATFFTSIFNRINSEKSAIHNESEWRNDLYKLSKKVIIMREDLELFRTCLSATRGIHKHNGKINFDKRTAKRFPEIDDICIFYYHYLCDNNKFNYINFDDINKRINFYSKNVFNNYSYLNNENEAIVFRQLCRLLLKADWEHRDVRNSILSKISFIVKVTDIDIKAVDLIYSLENDGQTDHFNLISNNADDTEKLYLKKLIVEKLLCL
ncbi:hypothetical protein [Apilactobacillus micheneri]|uniref:hypothetical protein n=1 Tax=Apilactobacillus micheneri TaxID=1899430 RepID=UPI000D03AF20|nr:hypothetical protein [Apilactobacillus micheneri]